MAKTIPKSLLKDLPLKLQESKVKFRAELLKSIESAIKSSECYDEDSVPAELAAKSLAKVLPLVIPRYSDSRSRGAVLELVHALLEHHLEATLKVFTSSLFDAFATWSTIIPTVSLSKTALFGLQWSSLVIKSAQDKE